MERRSLTRIFPVCQAVVCTAVVAMLCLAVHATDYAGAKPISIRSDAEFTPQNGVTAGSGMPDDPYVISNLEIDASAVPYGILVESTVAAFRIEDCHIFGAISSAVRLVATQSASVVHCSLEQSDTAIQLLESEGALVTGNEITGCNYAILLQLASANEVAYNKVTGGLLGIGLEAWSGDNVIHDNAFDCTVALAVAQDCNRNVFYRNNFLSTWLNCDAFGQWVSLDSEGNYWAGYHGMDADGDGFGDVAFSIPGVARQRDTRPAMTPYRAEPPEE